MAAAEATTQQAAEEAWLVVTAARQEANRLAREAQAGGLRMSGANARRHLTQEHRAATWAIVAPMLAAGMAVSVIAAELNRLGIPRQQTIAGWTYDAVCRLRTAVRRDGSASI